MTKIFLIHFFPHKHMIYPILMESGILTATPFINVFMLCYWKVDIEKLSNQ